MRDTARRRGPSSTTTTTGNRDYEHRPHADDLRARSCNARNVHPRLTQSFPHDTLPPLRRKAAWSPTPSAAKAANANGDDTRNTMAEANVTTTTPPTPMTPTRAADTAATPTTPARAQLTQGPPTRTPPATTFSVPAATRASEAAAMPPTPAHPAHASMDTGTSHPDPRHLYPALGIGPRGPAEGWLEGRGFPPGAELSPQRRPRRNRPLPKQATTTGVDASASTVGPGNATSEAAETRDATDNDSHHRQTPMDRANTHHWEPNDRAPGQTRVLTWNINGTETPDTVLGTAFLLHPHVIAIQEATRNTWPSGRLRQLETITSDSTGTRAQALMLDTRIVHITRCHSGVNTGRATAVHRRTERTIEFHSCYFPHIGHTHALFEDAVSEAFALHGTHSRV